MRCPKCGAFLEENRTKCFMCGADIDPNNAPTNEWKEETNTLPFNKQSEEKSYKDIDLNELKNNDKDIFDFFHDHKKAIIVLIILILLGVGAFVTYKIIKMKSTPEPDKPIIGSLFYEIGDEFTNVKKSQDTMVYTKTGSTGSDCSITINTGASTDSNHVKQLFDKTFEKLQPKNEDEEAIDITQQIERDESDYSMNGNLWYVMNVLYWNYNANNFSTLKYQYLSSIYKGYYYDIELANYSNDPVCNASLDTFRKSLKFIEQEE